jgi:GNAT superfamily N-acetyltransferase
MEQNQYRLRHAGAADAAIVARQRSAMFLDIGEVSSHEAELLRRASELWIADLMTMNKYVGWFLEHEGTPVSGWGIILWERPPAPGCLRLGKWAHIVNVYTAPDHRRRGLARRIMLHIIEWSAQNGIDHLTLGASREGRPLYESLGFEQTSQMRLAPERMHSLARSMELG